MDSIAYYQELIDHGVSLSFVIEKIRSEAIATARAKALRDVERRFDLVMSDLISSKLIKWESDKSMGAMNGQEILKRRAIILANNQEPPK